MIKTLWQSDYQALLDNHARELADAKAGATPPAIVGELTALFGDAAKAEGFDLKAAVQAALQQAADAHAELAKLKGEVKAAETKTAELTTKLEAANTTLKGVAALVDAKEGDNLVEKVGAIVPEKATTDVQEQNDPAKDKFTKYKHNQDAIAELNAMGVY